MLTAFSGWIVFGEKLPGLWWVGAAGLVLGNVIIGRREEDGDKVTVRNERGGEGEHEEERRERYQDIGDGISTDGLGGLELSDDGVKSKDGVQR